MIVNCIKYLDQIKEELKHNINIQELKIQNSKFIGKPEDKFETLLFLPPNPQRIAEGGLRTMGLFKFSYKKVGNVWYICDLEGNPAIPAPKELQEKINEYSSHVSPLTSHFLPLITVITVVYNGAKHLEETIDQSNLRWQDGGINFLKLAKGTYECLIWR